MENPLMEGALMLARNNIPVFPLREKAKTPLVKNWPDEATTDEKKIRAWWKQWPNANIGVLCGKKSNLLVFDLDGAEGISSFQNLQRESGQVDTPIIVKTGRGYHLWFKYPDGEKIPNSASRVGKKVDIRSDRGYVIAPPSIHPSGVAYQWVEAIDYEGF